MKSTLFGVSLAFGLASTLSAQQAPTPGANDGSASAVTKAQFSPDGKQITTTSQDQKVRIWDAKTGKALPAQAEAAEDLLAQAKKKAAAEHKAIFVHFGASWCGWCRKLDAFLESPDAKPAFEKYFVPVKLVVQENPPNKALENAGADSLLKSWGGPDGLPYSAFLDAHGKLIVNSKHDGNNIGYPAQPDERDYFVEMIKKAAPEVSQQDLNSITKALQNPAKPGT